MWAGHMGIGWYGVSDVPWGGGTLAAPAIGVRYWLSPSMGVDAALGFNMGSGSSEVTAGGTTTTTDKTVPKAFLIHGGVPLVLGGSQHAAILLTPEVNIGTGSATQKAKDANDKDTNYSGMLLQVGARAGAEVHFGFIGMPNLSLEGSVGAYFASVTNSTEKGDAKSKDSSTTIATSNINSPWDFFRSNVAARYYF
jgi:hypothetical protein